MPLIWAVSEKRDLPSALGFGLPLAAVPWILYWFGRWIADGFSDAPQNRYLKWLKRTSAVVFIALIYRLKAIVFILPILLALNLIIWANVWMCRKMLADEDPEKFPLPSGRLKIAFGAFLLVSGGALLFLGEAAAAVLLAARTILPTENINLIVWWPLQLVIRIGGAYLSRYGIRVLFGRLGIRGPASKSPARRDSAPRRRASILGLGISLYMVVPAGVLLFKGHGFFKMAAMKLRERGLPSNSSTQHNQR